MAENIRISDLESLNVSELSNNYNFVLDNGTNTKKINMEEMNKYYPALIQGKIPENYLPSYVDDVIEYSGKSTFPTTGEAGKIYVDTSDNSTYRWSGTEYVQIGKSVAVINELTSTSTTNALSAAMGKKLNDEKIDKNAELIKISDGDNYTNYAADYIQTIGTSLEIQSKDSDLNLVAKYALDLQSYNGNNKIYTHDDGISIESNYSVKLISDSIDLCDSSETSIVQIGSDSIVTKGELGIDVCGSSIDQVNVLSATTINVTDTINGDISGTAAKATADADGNTISETYLKATGSSLLTLNPEDAIHDGLIVSSSDGGKVKIRPAEIVIGNTTLDEQKLKALLALV